MRNRKLQRYIPQNLELTVAHAHIPGWLSIITQPDPQHDVEVLLDWNKVKALKYPILPHGLQGISDREIAQHLLAGTVEDAHLPKTAHSNDAARIAYLVEQLSEGNKLDAIRVVVGRAIDIHDGNHRLRAYQYTGQMDRVRATLSGHFVRVLDGCFTPTTTGL